MVKHSIHVPATVCNVNYSKILYFLMKIIASIFCSYIFLHFQPQYTDDSINVFRRIQFYNKGITYMLCIYR